MRILLVEDNADHGELMRLALTGHDAAWQVEGVVSGEEALRHLAEGEAYDVVFLDYSLPRPDGLEVLAQIRRGEAPPPVVMVTGRGDEQVAVEAMKGGAYDYIVKGEGYLQRLSVVAQRAVEARRLAAERKRAEEALKVSEARFKAVVSSAMDSIFIKDRSLRYILANPAMVTLFDMPVEEILGKSDADLFSPEIARHMEEVDRRVLAGEIVEEEPTKPVRGKLYTFQTIKCPLRGAEGAVVGLCGIARDITDRKRTEEALRESEGHYRRIVETANEGIWGIDGDSRTTFVNSQTASMLGYTVEEMIGRPLFSLMDEEWLAMAKAYVGRRQQGIRESHEFKFRRKDGTDLWAIVSATPIFDTQGKYEGAFAMITDITERKRAEESLVERTLQLEAVRAVSAEIAQELDFITLLQLIIRRAMELVGTAGGSIFLWDEETQVLVPQAWSRHAEWMPQMRLKLGEGVAGTVAERGEGLIINDYRHWVAASPLVLERTRIAAVVAEPLLCRERLAGVIVLDHEEAGRTFTEEDRRALALFAAQAAIAIENARLYDAAQREIAERKRAEAALAARTRQLETVRVLTAEIAQELDLTVLLSLITRRAAELVGATSGAISLWNGEAQLLIPRAWHGLGDWMSEMSIPLGAGVTGTVAERREGMIVNDYRSSLHALPSFLEHTETTAVMAEPLLYRDQLVGVITINNEGVERRFEEQDRETLRLFAAQAAIAIENARLHSATVRRGEELGALLRATRSVMSGLDLRGTLDRILGEAAQIAETPHVKTLLVDQDAMVLRLRALAGRPVELLAGFQMPLGVGLSGIVAMTGQPLFVPDCQHDPRNVYADQDRQLGLVTYLGLPIAIRGDVVGVLTFNTEQPRRYSPDELAYLASFADQAAIAIENARLFEQVRDGRERLESLSQRLLEVQEVERRTIARELHDEIGQLLTGLKLLLEMSARVKAERLQARLVEAGALVQDLLVRVRELSLNLRPAMLDDLGLLPALLWHFERYTAQTKFRVDFQHAGLERRFAPEIETAAYRIAQEALNNVVRHAKVTEATVRLWADETTLCLRIEDRGAGFDVEAALAASTSSGLLGMRERAALLGGRLIVTSTPRGGTQVVAELPLVGRVEKRRGQR